MLLPSLLWKENFIICLERTSVALEYAIGGTTIFQLIHAHLPLPVVSLLLALSALVYKRLCEI
jgi:hypothetical protein